MFMLTFRLDSRAVHFFEDEIRGRLSPTDYKQPFSVKDREWNEALFDCLQSVLYEKDIERIATMPKADMEQRCEITNVGAPTWFIGQGQMGRILGRVRVFEMTSDKVRGVRSDGVMFNVKNMGGYFKLGGGSTSGSVRFNIADAK